MFKKNFINETIIKLILLLKYKLTFDQTKILILIFKVYI